MRPDYPDRQNDWFVMAATAFDGYDLAGSIGTDKDRLGLTECIEGSNPSRTAAVLAIRRRVLNR